MKELRRLLLYVRPYSLMLVASVVVLRCASGEPVKVQELPGANETNVPLRLVG